MRAHRRITETEDLSATLWTPDRSITARPVLNLGEGGMLLADVEMDVGDLVSFEIAGLYFRYAGVAAAVHNIDGATGVHFVRWQGQVDRPLRALITARIVRRRLVGREPAPARR